MKYLIVTGDDFGRSAAVNEAIERAHTAGFLTQASLMVHEPAAAEAVRIAQRNPGLCVGLHLTLCAGVSAQAGRLTDAGGNLPASPVLAGLRYFFDRSLRESLAAEIRAQFEAFRALGFSPTYWDGHTHLHLHPTAFRLTLPIAVAHGFRAMRLVRSPAPHTPLSLIFHALSRSALPHLRAHGVRYADHTLGLRESGRVRTATAATLLAQLPPGTAEFYFHPGVEPEELHTATLLPLLSAQRIALVTSLDEPAS